MSVFAIADLHLALSIDKPMDIFGAGWQDYMEKLKNGWESAVEDGDTVIIPGDISWATYLDEAVEDFRFIEGLPGEKIISKGNHDYWWTTSNKLRAFLSRNGFSTIRFLHNNSFRIGNNILCGTRGWMIPGDDGFGGEDMKIYKRELQRLELSLNGIARKKEDTVIAVLHFPPFGPGGKTSGFVDILRENNVDICLYGHLHGEGFKNAVQGTVEGIEFKLVSSDYLGFIPLEINIG